MTTTQLSASDPRLEAALTYALARPGKQLRSRLCRTTAAMMVGAEVKTAATVGQAIEFLHTYSLIHDDLPAMDNDDLRRGQPTLHKVYDDATAILVGDGLQALAFEWISDTADLSADTKVRLIKLLTRSVGFNGMVGGQAMDMAAEGQSLDVSQLQEVHLRKTGALIEASVLAGAMCGHATAEQEALLLAFSRRIGLAFQVMDDVLDVTATSEALGKTAGKDASAEKSTYVGCMGVEGATRYASSLLDEAMSSLTEFGRRADPLKALSQLLVHRQQ